jgi:hypothetical protein
MSYVVVEVTMHEARGRIPTIALQVVGTFPTKQKAKEYCDRMAGRDFDGPQWGIWEVKQP